MNGWLVAYHVMGMQSDVYITQKSSMQLFNSRSWLFQCELYGKVDSPFIVVLSVKFSIFNSLCF